MKRKLLIAAASLSVFSLGALAQVGHRPFGPGPAVIVGGPGFEHPHAREEIDERLMRQNHRIDKSLQEDRISAERAMRLHEQNDDIADRTRRLAEFHGGYLSPDDVRMLNHDLDEVSREIGPDIW